MTFQLEIVSIDGQKFSGEAEKLSLRSQSGELAIMARHTNYCSGVGMGTASVTLPDGTVRRASCIGGMLSMLHNRCRLLPTSWEWSGDIDRARAEASKRRAEEALRNPELSKADRAREESRLYRAMVRLQTAEAGE
ncbi:F0F1 ATP synthase subunit epsilon [Oribacterium sp. oral taxon 102]|uniref:F0F1 ATP synthase subunit epsilon n=1 Tax=Oribacterium sp. oral taxon 102 TaxID=671214 RepID=UPI0015B93129|nr:F0F1 ATP synthase subunit epsilon [Oribacterium sp. oral taxon 102]NWO22263.1 F0F1 ATP synthase subunit epsilon [Oribacterium sp. oral taxon 102]